MPIPERLQDALDTLDMVPDRADRIQYLISLADSFQQVPEGVARPPFPESRRVPGCESEAFVFTSNRPDGTLDFFFAILNPQGVSAQALAVILQEGLSGASLRDILEVPDDLVYQVFGRELSMGKSLGLIGMLRMAKAEARKGL